MLDAPSGPHCTDLYELYAFMFVKMQLFGPDICIQLVCQMSVQMQYSPRLAKYSL